MVTPAMAVPAMATPVMATPAMVVPAPVLPATAPAGEGIRSDVGTWLDSGVLVVYSYIFCFGFRW